MSQLPANCINEIFEYLEKYKKTLYSCLSISHLVKFPLESYGETFGIIVIELIIL